MIILIGLGISLMVFLVFFWFFTSNSHRPVKTATVAESNLKITPPFTISSKDIEPIAGNDVLTTQLDLARAYIETGRKNLAKNILNNVFQHGNLEQKQEAQRLLAALQAVS